MPNVNSDGLFGSVNPGITRPGRSMDCSQLIEIRKRYAGVKNMVIDNIHNSKDIKPFFNQDKKVRDVSSNGAVNFYFVRGLTNVFSRVHTSK